MDCGLIETELKKRLAYPYQWGRRQSNDYDQATHFIYHTFSFADLLRETEQRFNTQPDYQGYFNYALNRWFNFWSSVAVEQIFCTMPGVKAALNPRDRLVDFTLQGITFDHKTSVFPKNFAQSLALTQHNPRPLIQWLYDNQSQEGRKHLQNRLFVVLYAADGEHWKLKAEIGWLQILVERYVRAFSPTQCHSFHFFPKAPTLSDVIWAVR